MAACIFYPIFSLCYFPEKGIKYKRSTNKIKIRKPPHLIESFLSFCGGHVPALVEHFQAEQGKECRRDPIRHCARDQLRDPAETGWKNSTYPLDIKEIMYNPKDKSSFNHSKNIFQHFVNTVNLFEKIRFKSSLFIVTKNHFGSPSMYILY